MSRETFEQQEPPEDSLREPIFDDVAHEVPLEFHLDESRREYAEVQSRIATLEEIFTERRSHGFGVPAHLKDRCDRLVARRRILEQQLGVGRTLDMFSGAAERAKGRPTSLAV